MAADCSTPTAIHKHLLLNLVTRCRSAQKAAEAAAAERSQRLRRIAAQEACLKESFLEAVESEKERLLLARQQRQPALPTKPASGQAEKVIHCFFQGHPGIEHHTGFGHSCDYHSSVR